jgi:plastocyanin
VDHRRRLLLATGASALVAAGVNRAAAATAATHSVTIDAFELKPPTLTVRRGDVVVWHNNDPVPHTITAKGSFDSGPIAAAATWKYTAAKQGRFEYSCTFHPTMKGVLIVE